MNSEEAPRGRPCATHGRRGTAHSFHRAPPTDRTRSRGRPMPAGVNALCGHRTPDTGGWAPDTGGWKPNGAAPGSSASDLLAADAAQPAALRRVQHQVRPYGHADHHQYSRPERQQPQQENSYRHTTDGDLRIRGHPSRPFRGGCRALCLPLNAVSACQVPSAVGYRALRGRSPSGANVLYPRAPVVSSQI